MKNENILFKVPNVVSNKDVIENMKYFKNEAREITEIFQNDTTRGRNFAIELRKELKTEYENNNLIKTQEYYNENESFWVYKDAVQDAYVHVTGPLDKGNKTGNFLDDVEDYMRYNENFLK